MNEFFGDLTCNFCGEMPVGVLRVQGPTPRWLPKWLASHVIELMRVRYIVYCRAHAQEASDRFERIARGRRRQR